MLLDFLSLLLLSTHYINTSSRVLIGLLLLPSARNVLKLFARCFMTEKLELHNNYFMPGFRLNFFFLCFGDKKWLLAEMYSMMLVSWSAFGRPRKCVRSVRERVMAPSTFSRDIAK